MPVIPHELSLSHSAESELSQYLLPIRRMSFRQDMARNTPLQPLLFPWRFRTTISRTLTVGFWNRRRESSEKEIAFISTEIKSATMDKKKEARESFGAFCQAQEHPVKARRVVRSVWRNFPTIVTCVTRVVIRRRIALGVA